MRDLTSFDGTRLALTIHGPADAPTVVLVHGLGSSTETWGEVPARLAAALTSGLQRGWSSLLRAAALAGRRLRTAESLSNRLSWRYAFAPGEPPEVVARVRESFLSSRPRALAATTFASASHDGVRLAPALDVPTLVLHGDAGPEVPAEEAQALMSALPDAELIRLPGAGHKLPSPTEHSSPTRSPAGSPRR